MMPQSLKNTENRYTKMSSKPNNVRQEEDLILLKGHIGKITNYLKDLKGLSELCQDVYSDGEATKVDEKDNNAQQSFSKTVLDILSTIKDVLCLLVFLYKSVVTDRDWKQILEEFQLNEIETENQLVEYEWKTQPSFVDPSVRFFGIDWESIFRKCSTIESDVLNFCANVDDQSMSPNDPNTSSSCCISNILSELAFIEAHVNFHSEAVMQGRLSKSHQKLIETEQLKYSSFAVSKTGKVPKSLSFCESSLTYSSSVRSKQRTSFSFKRSKTTKDLNASARRREIRGESGGSSLDSHENLEAAKVEVDNVTEEEGAQMSKKKVSLIRNISLMLRNMR